MLWPLRSEAPSLGVLDHTAKSISVGLVEAGCQIYGLYHSLSPTLVSYTRRESYTHTLQSTISASGNRTIVLLAQ